MTAYSPEDVFNFAKDGDKVNLLAAISYGDNRTNWFRNYIRETALHMAAAKGHIECIRVLLHNDANVDITNRCCEPPSHYAADNGHTECLRLLLDIGADINSKNDNNGTLLHRSAQEGHTECVKLLLDRGAIIAYDIAEYGPNEDDITDCKPMILEQRKKIAAFKEFITHHIEYPPNKNTINSICYPSGNLLAMPSIGWPKAELLRYKYYFDDLFFYVHLYVAKIYTMKKLANNNKSDLSDLWYSTKITELARKNNETSTLMTVLTDRLKDYLDLNINLCCNCHDLKGKLQCSRCKIVYYCSSECHKLHWKHHKLECKVK